MGLVQVVALGLPFNTGMEVIDDFFMPELTIAVLPAAICVQPENGLILGDLYGFNFLSHINQSYRKQSSCRLSIAL